MDVATEIAPVDLIMAEMGFTPFDTGPYVTELRGVVAEKVERGMIYTSAGTGLTPERPIGSVREIIVEGLIVPVTLVGRVRGSAELRAKERLAMNWEIEQGMTYRVDCIDGTPWGWSFNAVTMKRRWRVQWRQVLPWLGDRRREAVFLVKRWWRRRVLKQVNPYRDAVA